MFRASAIVGTGTERSVGIRGFMANQSSCKMLRASPESQILQPRHSFRKLGYPPVLLQATSWWELEL